MSTAQTPTPAAQPAAAQAAVVTTEPPAGPSLLDEVLKASRVRTPSRRRSTRPT